MEHTHLRHNEETEASELEPIVIVGSDSAHYVFGRKGFTVSGLGCCAVQCLRLSSGDASDACESLTLQ